MIRGVKFLDYVILRMVLCKFCKSSDFHKNGYVRGLQRYRCKNCLRNFTITALRGFCEQDKLKALFLYSSGLSMNRIAQFFGVSTVAVLKWIRILGSKYCAKITPSSEDKVMVMEVDEFWHFLKKKSEKYGFLKPMIVIENDSLTGNLVIALMQHS